MYIHWVLDEKCVKGYIWVSGYYCLRFVKRDSALCSQLCFDSLVFAGSYPPSSPKLSSFMTLSENINEFLGYKIVHNVGEMESYYMLIDEFSHYVWASGYRKGLRLDKYHAEALLELENFDSSKLEPIYKKVPRPMHGDSVDIQNILGNTKVLEYGSFVD